MIILGNRLKTYREIRSCDIVLRYHHFRNFELPDDIDNDVVGWNASANQKNSSNRGCLIAAINSDLEEKYPRFGTALNSFRRQNIDQVVWLHPRQTPLQYHCHKSRGLSQPSVADHRLLMASSIQRGEYKHFIKSPAGFWQVDHPNVQFPGRSTPSHHKPTRLARSIGHPSSALNHH